MNSKVFWFIFLSTTTQGISLADYPRILYDETIDTPVTTTEMPATTKESNNVPKWIPASNGVVPTGAIMGGRDMDNSILYVARARHNTHRGYEIIPGKLKPSNGVTYISVEAQIAGGSGDTHLSVDGMVHAKKNYEVLVGCKANWVKTKGNQIPANAIQGGEAYDGPYYVCRVDESGVNMNGKMHFTDTTCYITLDGYEFEYFECEVLCCT